MPDEKMTQAFGALIDQPDERDWKLDNFLAGSSEIPATYEIPDIRMISVKNQGSKPTCVSYSAASVKEWQEGREIGKNIDFSGELVYWLATVHHGASRSSGMYFRDGMKILEKTGAIELPFFPETKTWEEFDREENRFQMEGDWKAAAAPYQIKSYARVTPKLQDIQRAILATGPVMIGVHAANFKTNRGLVEPMRTEGGHHAVVAVGWTARGLKILNSWGKNWGVGGFAEIPFNEVDKRTFTAWSSVDKRNPNLDKVKVEAAFAERLAQVDQDIHDVRVHELELTSELRKAQTRHSIHRGKFRKIIEELQR